MAQNNWLDEGSTPVPQPTSAAADTSWLDEQSDISQDNALVRGFKKSSQSIGITKGLLTGDSADTARKVAEATDYARKNPGTKEGAELMDAWNRGDGVTGGVTEVAGEFAKDWRGAKGFIPGVRATAKNLQAMGSGIIEEVPNMIAPVAGMIAGGAAGSAAAGPVGTVLGGWAGASLGNTAVEGGSMVQEALQKHKINPADQAAVSAYLDKNGDRILGQAGVKGAIIGAVDTATAGLGHFLLSGPGKAAASRALADMGVDAADKAAVRAAQSSAEFKNRIASDAAYQATQQGANKIARNAGAAALEPAGEFAGEFVGQGVATGEWDTKNAALEAASSIGQSGAMYAGQKAIQAFSRPGAATNDPSEQPVPAPGQPPAADTPPADVPPGDGQAGPGGGLGAPTGAGADMAGMLAPANPLLEAMNQRAADPSAIAPPIDDGKIFDKSAAAPVAGELYQPGDTTNPLTGERITAKPSEAMGINPADGPLSTGAALAVDTGVSEQMQQAAALAEAVKAAPKTPAGEAKTAAPDLSGWSDQQLSDTFRAAQAPDVRRQLAVELSRRRDVREQQALRQEMDAEQAAMDMQDAPDDAFANVREDAGAPNLQDGPSHSVADGVADKGRQPTVSQQPKEASSGTQAQETQQAGAGQQEARAGQAGARDESHLNALELRLSHERGRLRAAKTDAERATRQVTVDGIEREIAGERKFLGLAPQAASAMSDDALMQALKPDGAEKTSTAQPPLSGTISPQPQAAGSALAAPEFTTIKTVHGDSVTVRTSDLQGDAPRLRQYTKAGKAKAVPAIHRDNLDLTGEKSAERAKENAKNLLFHTVTTKDGGAFASQAAAQREVNRLGLQDSHEVVEAGGGFVGRIKKTGEQHGATARNLRLADERTPGAGAAAPHGPGESVAGEAPVVGAGQRQTGDAGRLDGATTEQPVSSLFTGKPDPINSAPLRELDGFKVGDAVDVPGRTIGRSTVEALFRQAAPGLGMVDMARVVGADGKKLDVLVGELRSTQPVAQAAESVTAAANEAATSPHNDLPEPVKAALTEDQAVADLRRQLREVEDKILAAAPASMAKGGGDIEAAMKSRAVPVTLKAQRKKLKEQIQQAQSASESQSNQPQAQTQQAQAAIGNVASTGQQATHKDPGQAPEAATPAVVAESLQKAARNEDTKPSEMRKWLVAEIDKELLQAPDRADYDEAVKRLGEKDAISGYTGNGPLGKNNETGYVTFDVPGDGKYKVRNSVRGLLEFRKNVMASQGFKDSGQKRAKPEQNDGVQGGSGGSMTAIANMIEEGDFEAARDYAEAVGIKLEDVKVPRGENAPAWKVFLSTGKVPEQKPVSREWTITNEQNPNGTWSRVAKLKRTADGAEYEATVTGTLDNTRATYVLTKDGKEYSRMTSGQPFSAAIELAENAMPAANDKPAPSKASDAGWNMAGTGYGGKRYIGRNITLDDGREVVARVYENAGTYEEVEVKVDGVRKFTVTDRDNAQGKADAFIKTLTSKDGDASAPVAEPPAPTGRTYLAVPFNEKDYAKRAGAKWDEGKKLWYADPVGGDGAAAGEININLKQYVPQDSTKDDRYNYYGDKALATSVALNASARDGVQYDTIKRKHPDGMMMWSVVKAGEQTQAAGSAKSPTRVTPQISGNPEKFIKVAADSVRELRSVDVDRVLTETPVQFRAEVASYIRDQRKDLADEVDDVMADIQPMAAAPAPAPATTGARRDPAKVSMFNPYEDGDIVTINGQDWTVKQDTPGWYLTNTGNWRGTHPTIRNIKAMADLIREVEQAATASPAAQPEAPKLTPAEAKSLMEWQDMGQKDGVKTHALTFYESQADKDAKRGRMIVAKVSKGDRSASNWHVDGDDKPFAVLGMAKKRAEEIGMAKAVADGFVAEDNPFAEYNALAKQYGYEVRPDGAIGSDGKFPGPTMKVKGGRLRIESGSGNLLASYAGTSPDGLGKFLESFWYAEKKSEQALRQEMDAEQAALDMPDAPDDEKVRLLAMAGSDRAADDQNQNDLLGNSAGPMYSRAAKQSTERNLLITHNLTPENLLHAVKMGGLAAPSLAVTTNTEVLTEFGSITLVGKREMADPKGYANTRVFGADIYSPRYPAYERVINNKKYSVLVKRTQTMADALGQSLPYASDLHSDGYDKLERSPVMLGQFLQDNGINPKMVWRPGMEPGREERLRKFGLGPFMQETDAFDLHKNPEFRKAGLAELIDMYVDLPDRGRMVERLKSDEDVQDNMLRDLAREIATAAKRAKRPELDQYETTKAMRQQIKDAGLSEAYQQAINDTLERMTDGERIFNGFTHSGNRRYIPHTLDNVVKILKTKLRGGESFNYGAGSLRAHYTPQFKSVDAIRKAKDRLVSAEQFEKIKKEIDDDLQSVAHAIAPNLGPSEATGILADAAKIGVRAAFKVYGHDASADVQAQTQEFLDKLRNLPTAYFEAKILRPVVLSEFAGAVVPDNLSAKALQALHDGGITNIQTYKAGDDAARKAAVLAFSEEAGEKVLFSRSGDNAGNQGARDGQRQTASGIPAGLPAKRTADSDRLQQIIDDDLRRNNEPPGFKALAIGQDQLPDAIRSALAGFERATGTRVVVFRNLTPQIADFNGITVRDGVLYINETAQNPATSTAAHEWLHNLRKTNPELYQQLSQEVRRQGDAYGFAKDYGYPLRMGEEELTAAAVGDALTDPVFLQRLAERDQSAFRRVAKAFLEFLKTLTAGWKDQGSNAYLEDVEAFRDKLEQVLDKLPVAKQKPGAIEALFLRVWHGSPHRGVEKTGFKLNKIGTGEGAQAYGWGMYFASMREVAERYKSVLETKTKGGVFYGGRRLTPSERRRLAQEGTPAERNVFGTRWPTSKAVQQLQSRADEYERDAQAKQAQGSAISLEWAAEYRRRAADLREVIAKLEDRDEQRNGQLYSLDIPIEESDLLDWDKPLSEQPEKVRQALIRADVMDESVLGEYTGQQLYEGMVRDRTMFDGMSRSDSAKAASEHLQSLGIPGLRYLDGNSRRGGQGSHNYVIWDEALMTPEAARIEAMYSRQAGSEETSPANFEGRAQRRPGTAQDKAVMQAMADGKSARDILRLIADTSRSRFNRQVARLLLKTGITPEVVFADTDLGGGDGFKFKAKYSRAQDRVTLTGEAAGQAEQIMLHELIHAATLRALDRKGLASLQMRRLFEHVQKHGGLAGTYGMKNVGEFTSEAFTNPEFQRALRQIAAPPGGRIKAAWDGFVRILRSILGLPQSEHSALSQALELGVAVMREDMALRQRGVVARGRDAQAGIDQTQTEAFKRWFKDSKVVDAEGKPLVVYHGTASDFSVFDGSKSNSRSMTGVPMSSFVFSTSPEAAGTYAGRFDKQGWDTPANQDRWQALWDAGKIREASKFMHQHYGTRESVFNPGSRIMPVYLSIKNPLIVDAKGAIWKEIPWRGGKANINGLAAFAKKQGHDGLIVRNVRDQATGTDAAIPADTVFAFHPEQIKSAIGNNGNFDPEDADIAHFGAAELARNMGEGLKSITRTDVRQAGRHKLTDWLKYGLQFLGRRQLVDIYGDVLPMREYDRLAAQMEADKNDAGAAADDLARRWGKLPDEGKLADLMHDATLAQIDADSDVPTVAGDDRAKATMLKARFKALTPEAQQVYRQVRDSYSAHHAQVRDAIRARIMRSELGSAKREELLKRMDDDFFKKVKGVYFPLARFGKYVVAVKDADGMVASVSRAETMDEAEALRQEMLKAFPKDKGFAVGRVTLDKEFVANHQMVGRGFMTELYRALDDAGLDSAQLAELEDTLGQLYLSSLPDLSWAKHGIHRKGTPGFSQDARRAFAQNMFHGTRYLAKLRYGDLMQDELDRMQQHVDDWSAVEDFDQPGAQRVVDEMRKRHDAAMNPKANPLSTALTSFGFIYHLGLSPAAAVVNLSQTAMVAYPVMAGKWGYQKAGAALLRASREAVAGKNDIRTQLKDADEIIAYDAAVKAGVIDVTQSHDLAGIAQGEDSGVMWKLRPVMRAASFLFHHAERFNRQSTFIAAYRLARETGAAHQDAYEQAVKATYDGHFDYASGNRPRIMQGNVARVVLLFKQFAQNMIYTLGRQAYLSVQGETPEVRRQARKVFAGLITTHAMGAGVLGLPLVGPLLAMASMLGGSDDEPWDAEVALRNMLAEAMGPTAAEVVAKGVSRLTPWDISGRIGLDKLIFPDVQEGLEGQRWAEAFATGMLGPVVGIGVNAARAAQKMGDGDYGRALEDLLPVALRNPIKAVRFASEGAKDRTGVAIKDEVGSAGVLGQAIGFSPSEVRLAQEGKSAVMDADRRLNERRAQLLGQFAKAAMTQDAEGMREADAAIARFNEKNPGRRITAPQKWQSVRRREQRIREAEDGVYLPRNRRDAMQAGAFAAT